MQRLMHGLVVGLLASGLTGCLMSRQITDVVAHNDYNSYKVQTLSAYFAPFAAWQEWTVWNCYRTAAGFRCSELEYEQNKAGFQPQGALPPPPQPPAAEEPAELPPAEQPPAEQAPPPAEQPPSEETPPPAEKPPSEPTGKVPVNETQTLALRGAAGSKP